MPGRISTRSARPSTSSKISRKSSVPTLNSRASTASRVSSPLITPPQDGPSTPLRTFVCSIFGDSQRNTSGHRKLAVRLRKVQEECCYEPTESRNKKSGHAIEYGEEDFNAEVIRCAVRVLGVKRTEAAGDRVVRFLGLFLKAANEKDAAIIAESSDPDQADALPETPTSRLTFNLLSVFIPLLIAKEKTVRFRATQVTSHIVNSLDAIDDELYYLIRQGLVKRIRDKEPTIRIQAVLGLGRLAGNEMDENHDEDEEDDMDTLGLLNKLLDVLQNDISAEVRRSLLLNLPLTPATLPFLLERARDLDAPTRRALYARLLPTLGDFRHLSLSMREKLLRWGLRDRDENVRKAAGRLFRERWIEDCAGPQDEEAEEAKKQESSPPKTSALLELLERVDIINSGVENGIALEAMKNFWEGRPDYLDAVIFDDEFFNNLTPESAFIARSFNDFCQQEIRYQGIIEEKMPEVTKLGYYLQKYINILLEAIAKAAHSDEGNEEETVELEFVVEQLLHIALTLDYSDEIGRRRMFSLLREALSMADLPEEVTRLTIEALRLVCGVDAAGEREFCAIVLEAIAEVHDNILSDPEEGNESFVSAQSEVADEGTPTHKSSSKTSKSGQTDSTMSSPEQDSKAVQEIMINMKCLHIAQCMLQNVDGNLQQNISLVTMLNNLVVPAVRSHEAPIRERGILCLGLCCLLDRTLAEENTTLFIHCFTKGHESLQATSLQILCDILTTHPTLLSATEPPSTDASQATESSPVAAPQVASYQKPLLKSFHRALKPTSPPTVQSAAATSLSKLLLTSRLNIPPSSLNALLQALLVCFFSPQTASNPALRQALAYFLPVYAHSRLENCERMAKVAVGTIHAVLAAADEWFTVEAEEDSDGEVDEGRAEKEVKECVARCVGLVGEWTDPRRVVLLDSGGFGGGRERERNEIKGGTVGLRLVAEILERVLGQGCRAEEKRFLLSLLGKVYVPAAVSGAAEGQEEAVITTMIEEQKELAQSVKELLDEAITEGVANDAAGRNTLVKVKNAVLKVIKSGEAQAQGKAAAAGRKRQSGSSSIGKGGGSEDEEAEVEMEAEPAEQEQVQSEPADGEDEDATVGLS
ncbi:MAG: hypothetical protein Q9227_001335 [Pyrenula ochraceoflavens]